MNGKWVFTNLNTFVSLSFSIQNSNNKFYLAAFDKATKMWVRVSDTTDKIEEALDLMRHMQESMAYPTFSKVTYYEMKFGGDAE